MKLTTTKIKNTKFADKPVKLFDGGGLYLHIQKSGKYWRYKYRFDKKEKVLSFGCFPEVTLKDAREHHVKARALLQDGVDPSMARKKEKALVQLERANTLETVAREFLERKTNWAESNRRKVVGRLQKDIFPALGDIPIGEVSAPQILAVLRTVEDRGAVDTAHRLRQTIGQIFRYGISTGKCQFDPAQALRGALLPLDKSNYPVPEIEQVGGILRAIAALETVRTRIALMIASNTAPRSAELTGARWDEVDLEQGIWTVPASRMKHRAEHQVYLASQVLVLLRELQLISGNSEFLFPGNKSKRPIVGATLVSGLRRAGIEQEEMVFHSFRGIFSTICNERLHANYDVVEKCLAHKDRDSIRAAYNRAQYKEQRIELMQQYADYIDSLRDHRAQVVNLF